MVSKVVKIRVNSRFRICLFLVFLSFFVIGCQSDTRIASFSDSPLARLGYTPVSDEDDEVGFSYNGESNFITATPDGYYFMSGNFLFYMDRETMEPVLLDPQLTTDDLVQAGGVMNWDLAASSAYFANPTGLYYYDGKLYVLADESPVRGEQDYPVESGERFLFETTADGSTREPVLPLTSVDDISIHRGFLYYLASSYNSDLAKTLEVHRVEIGKWDSNEVISHLPDSAMLYPYSIKAFDDYLYLHSYSRDPETMIHANKYFALNITANNIIDLTTVRPEDLKDDYTMATPEVQGDSLWLTYRALDDSKVIYKANLDGSNPERVMELEKPEFLWSNGILLQIFRYNDTFFINPEEAGEHTAQFVDRDGKPVGKVITYPVTDHWYRKPIVGDAYYTFMTDNHGNLYAMNLEDLNIDSPVLRPLLTGLGDYIHPRG